MSPLLGKAFGGSTGLVDVSIERDPRCHAPCPKAHRRPAHSKLITPGTRAASGDGHRIYDSVAEIHDLLGFASILREAPYPILKETADRFGTLASAKRPARNVPYRVGPDKAHNRPDVSYVGTSKRAARKLNRVGGRGLLGHPLGTFSGCLRVYVALAHCAGWIPAKAEALAPWCRRASPFHGA